MGWLIYVLAWLAAAIFWTLAAASGAGRTPLATLPFGLLAVGSAGIMGVAVWWLSRRVPWNLRSISFYAVHVTALAAFSVIYTMSSVVPDALRGHGGASLAAIVASPVYKWNLLIGSWLYVMVGGLSYAIRADRRVRAEEAAAAQARLLLQQSQLAALRAQLNPHFLFNALHTIGALMASDPRQADLALERLGDLLRYALGTDEEVLFSQEWKFTQDYLSFEQLRLGDRLRVNAAVDPATCVVPVPPLILQPLVENAVRHGIADRAEGGQIQISGRIDSGRLIFHVRNDAHGETVNGSNGLGLSSVRQRVAALYGNRAAVRIDRDEGFGVTVEIPIEDIGVSS